MKNNNNIFTAAVIIGIIIPLVLAIPFMIYTSSLLDWGSETLDRWFSISSTFIIMITLICGFSAIILIQIHNKR